MIMEPITLTPQSPALFFDDRCISRFARLTRCWHQPRKVNQPVLCGQQPWDRAIVCYGSIVEHLGKLYCWYVTWLGESQLKVCLATSDDGIHWSKPSLGLFDTPGLPGDRNNNIVMTSSHDEQGGFIDNLSVIHEPDDQAYPFKCLYWDSGPIPRQPATEGIHAARSADGIHWEHLGLVMPGSGDRFNACPVRIAGRYVAWVRSPDMFDTQPRTRKIYRVHSDNLTDWSEPELILEPDLEDPALMQYYSLMGFPYAGRMLGFLERMHMSPDVLDTELLWSDDLGCSFERSRTRQAFLAPGQAGSWDDTWINLPASMPLIRKNRMWFYYSARADAHGMAEPHHSGGIGLSTLRIDGFVSLKAVGRTSTLTTGPLYWTAGMELGVNFDPRQDLQGHPTNAAIGELRVEVQDLNGRPLPGLSLAECQTLYANTSVYDGSYAPIAWRCGATPAKLNGHGSLPIQLHIQLRHGHLYGIKPLADM